MTEENATVETTENVEATQETTEIIDNSSLGESSSDSDNSGGEDAEYIEAMKAAGVDVGTKDETPDLEKMASEDDNEEDESKDTEDNSKDEEKTDDKDSDENNKDSEEDKGDSETEFSMKLKVDGEEVEYKDQGEIQKLAQLGLAADKRFDEAGKLRQKAESFLNQLKNDPISVLENPSLEINFREIAEDYLYKQIEFEGLSDSEQRAIKAERELGRLKNREFEQNKREQRQTHEREIASNREAMSRDINTALNESGIPQNQWTMARMAGYMRQALQRGLPTDPKQFSDLVRKDFAESQQQLLSGLSDDDLLKTIGKDAMDRIRKNQVEKFKAKEQRPRKVENLPSKEKNQRFYSSVDEMRDSYNS